MTIPPPNKPSATRTQNPRLALPTIASPRFKAACGLYLSQRAIHKIGFLLVVALFLFIVLTTPTIACVPMPNVDLQQLDSFRRKDPEKAIAIATHRLQESGTAPSLDRAQLYSIIALARGNENRTADARAALESARHELSLVPRNAASHVLELIFAEIEYGADDTQAEYERGLQQLDAILPTTQLGTKEWACLLKVRAAFQFHLERTDLAVADALTAYRLAKANQWDDIAAFSALELADAYRRAGLWAAARQMIDETTQYLQRHDLTYWLAMAEFGTGAIEAGQGHWQTAFEAFDRTVDLQTQLGDHLAVGIAGIFLCDRLLDAGRLTDAEARCPQSAEIFSNAKRYDLVTRLGFARARIALAKSKYGEALAAFDDIAKNHLDALSAAMLPGFYQDRASALAHFGRDREARIDLERSIAARRDLNEAAHVRAAAVLAGIQNSDALQERNERLERENRYRQSQQRLAAGVALGALMASALLAFLLRTQIRLRREITRQSSILTTLTSNLSDTVLLVDSNLRVQFANRSLRVGSGVAPGGLLADAVPTGDSSQFTNAVNAVVSSRQPSEFYASWRGIDGVMRHYEQRATPVLDGDTLVGVTVRSTDVTARRDLENALRLQARILDTMNDGVLVLNERGRIKVANAAMHTILGAPTGELIGSSIQARFAHERGTEEMTTLMSGAHLRSRELALVRNDDLVCLLAITTATLEVDDERVFVWVCRDITWQRRVERALVSTFGRDATCAALLLQEGLAQELVGVSLFLRSTIRQLQSDKVANAIRTATEHLTAAIHTAQDLAQLMSPMTPIRGSVGDGLGALCEETSMRLGIPVEYDEISCPFEMSTATGDQVYRIAEEALATAGRARGCKQIRVAVSASDADLRIDIRWSITQTADGGHKLAFVRDLEFDLIAYRARLLGGASDHGQWEGGEFFVVRIPASTEGSGIDSEASPLD